MRITKLMRRLLVEASEDMFGNLRVCRGVSGVSSPRKFGTRRHRAAAQLAEAGLLKTAANIGVDRGATTMSVDLYEITEDGRRRLS